jgi:hypothetical protein
MHLTYCAIIIEMKDGHCFKHITMNGCALTCTPSYVTYGIYWKRIAAIMGTNLIKTLTIEPATEERWRLQKKWIGYKSFETQLKSFKQFREG